MNRWGWKLAGLVIVAACCIGVRFYAESEFWHDSYVYDKGVKCAVDERKQSSKGTNLTELARKKRQEREREDAILAHWLDNMTLEQKLAQCMILTNEKDMTAWNMQVYQPGGVIFFGVDFRGKTVDQVAARVENMQQWVATPLFVGVDEEGGEISRVQGLLEEDLPIFASARTLWHKGEQAVIDDTETKTKLLQRMGVNLNFDPVADVVTDSEAYMYDRSASGDPEQVADYVETVVSVMRDRKMGSCLKHFPGYGNNDNTHATFATDHRNLDVYRKDDFLPFTKGITAGAEMIMVSHITMEKVDAKNPASLSPAVHDLLREELAFDGVVIADDLNMQAILLRMPLEEATGQALAAGNDMIFSADFAASMKGAKQALQEGKITQQEIEDSVRRILRYKLHLGLLE